MQRLQPKTEFCDAIDVCEVETPYGKITGKKCKLSNVVYHNTILEKAQKIAESGVLKAGQKANQLGQDVLSLSSCPTQPYGGNMKFVIKATDDMIPMCYYDWTENKQVDHELSKEASQSKLPNGEPLGENRVRGKYGVNSSSYTEECEYLSRKDIPLKDNLQSVEFWIPWRLERFTFNHGCGTPAYANVDGRDIGVLMDEIERAQQVADKLGVPLEVKSCFAAMDMGYDWGAGGHKHILLTKENLEKLKRGIRPEAIRGPPPEVCLC